MADQCGRCACVMEDWEHDLCLVCGVIVELSGEADRLRRLASTDPDHEGARTWRTPGGRYTLNLDPTDPDESMVAWWLGDHEGYEEFGRVNIDEHQLREMIADLTRRLVLISRPAARSDRGGRDG